MTSTPNDSLNASDQLMDLSIKNFWVIVYYPASDPGSEFEIISNKDLSFDSWDVLERGAEIDVKFGNAKVQAIVVTVSDDYSQLTTNFKSIIEEYTKEEVRMEDCSRRHKPAKNLQDKKHRHCRQRKHATSHREVIKIADKDTQTEPVPESESLEYVRMKRQYEELENKYNDLKAAVTEVKTELQGSILRLNVLKSEDTDQPKVPQTLSDNKENAKQMVQIGSGGTKIPRHVYNSIKWGSYSAATRKLLITLFPRSVLASHSLTGKPSPAFISSNKQTKMRLDPTVIADIIEIITKKCLVAESLVRNAITTKCADENKMYRKRMEREETNGGDVEPVKRFKLI